MASGPSSAYRDRPNAAGTGSFSILPTDVTVGKQPAKSDALSAFEFGDIQTNGQPSENRSHFNSTTVTVASQRMVANMSSASAG